MGCGHSKPCLSGTTAWLMPRDFWSCSSACHTLHLDPCITTSSSLSFQCEGRLSGRPSLTSHILYSITLSCLVMAFSENWNYLVCLSPPVEGKFLEVARIPLASIKRCSVHACSSVLICRREAEDRVREVTGLLRITSKSLTKPGFESRVWLASKPSVHFYAWDTFWCSSKLINPEILRVNESGKNMVGSLHSLSKECGLGHYFIKIYRNVESFKDFIS